jgi:hypothetical protein
MRIGHLLMMGIVFGGIEAVAEPIPVELVSVSGTTLLVRADEPYFIRGVGGTERLEELASIGGNSIRTWGPPEKAFLDAAHASGLSVCVGLWIEHERHGFDYDDAEAVAAQIARHCASIDRLKDHPAVLMWGIGNEVELNYTNRRVWDVIEAVAAHAKRVDPHHPTMTVLAHVPVEAVREVMTRCPSIDILGINSYGGLGVVSAVVRAAGWTGPYVVTEWGTDGAWEVTKTQWGAEIEPTSTQKARLRAERLAMIATDRERCLGGYAFYWGNKQETTATWFNLFLEDGRYTEEYEVLREVWGGKGGKPSSPRIAALFLNESLPEASVRLEAGEPVRARVGRMDSVEPVEFEWVLKAESTDKRQGGDAEERAPVWPLEILVRGEDFIEFKSPSEPGPYRLYVYLRGPDRTAATANFPFYVTD